MSYGFWNTVKSATGAGKFYDRSESNKFYYYVLRLEASSFFCKSCDDSLIVEPILNHIKVYNWRKKIVQQK